MLNKCIILVLFFMSMNFSVFAATTCDEDGLWLQVLGSGGPELDDGRASSSYVIWSEGRARFVIDIGSGSMFQFEQSGASINDIEAIMLSHMHVDHSNDLPALIKASFFSNRSHDLPIFGPSGNNFMPSLKHYVDGLFGNEHGAYRYLSSYLDGSDTYRLLPHNVDVTKQKEETVLVNSQYKLIAIPVHHGVIPALAWRVEFADKAIVFSGDMSNRYNTLVRLAKQADILVAHNAVPEGVKGVARSLHMPPSVIGQIAEQAHVKQLVISHRMKRTLGQEKTTLTHIRKKYEGPVMFADDLQCFRL